MLGIENLYLFLVTGILLNLFPGPDTVYIVSRSVSQGRMAGVLAVFGMGSGTIVHTIAGACGFSALLMTSAHALMIVKYAGAAYLVYQGIRIILEKNGSGQIEGGDFASRNLFGIYRQGALTNILNPKVAVFFLAFLPQFISVSSPNKTFSFVVLGLLFITTGTIWCLLLAFFAARFSQSLRSNTVLAKGLKRVNGLVFCGLGLKLAFAKFEI